MDRVSASGRSFLSGRWRISHRERHRKRRGKRRLYLSLAIDSRMSIPQAKRSRHLPSAAKFSPRAIIPTARSSLTAIPYLLFVDGGFKPPYSTPPIAIFMAKQQAPSAVSSQRAGQHADCTLLPGLFGTDLRLHRPLDTLFRQSGPDSEISVTQATRISISTLQVPSAPRKHQKYALLTLPDQKRSSPLRYE